jgi:hypothetical protein
MLNKKNKGETAIELLMTYGWAILIILIVAGVLAYYGIFSPRGFLEKQTNYDYVTTISSNPTLFCNKLDNETFACDVKFCFSVSGLTSEDYCQDVGNTSAIFRLTKE